MIDFFANGRPVSVDGDADMPLLWALRDMLGLTGTNSAAASPPAAPARCTSTASPCAPAHSAARGGGQPDHDHRGLAQDRCHPLQRAWIESRCRNAAIASPA